MDRFLPRVKWICTLAVRRQKKHRLDTNSTNFAKNHTRLEAESTDRNFLCIFRLLLGKRRVPNEKKQLLAERHAASLASSTDVRYTASDEG